MADLAADEAKVTRDAFFGGRLTLLQPAKGHRAGTDAVLLAAAVPRDFAGLVYDAGAGVGTVGLALILDRPKTRVGLIERDRLNVEIAIQNVALNNVLERASVHACDLLSGSSRRGAGVVGEADLIVTNPPFYKTGTVRESSDQRRRAAHVGADGAFESWLAACLTLLRSRGDLILIQTPESLPQLLRALEQRAGAITILPVHMKADAPAKRILLRARKGSQTPLTLLSPLILRDEYGWTDRAERINLGEGLIDW